MDGSGLKWMDDRMVEGQGWVQVVVGRLGEDHD